MGIESRRQARRTVPGMMEVYDTITEEPVPLTPTPTPT